MDTANRASMTKRTRNDTQKTKTVVSMDRCVSGNTMTRCHGDRRQSGRRSHDDNVENDIVDRKL